MIEVSHLVKSYGNKRAVDDLSFHVEKGQIYGFLGPNGAGKSTTMNIITGYLAPTSGDVKIDGHDIMAEPKEVKKHIGYLPEMPPLYQEMTVMEYLRFVAQLKKIPAKKRKDCIDAAMEKTGISEVNQRLIRNLSKGYKQRVGLAQALLGEPEVIILDEPTVGLDPKQIIEIRELIRGLKDKHTVILSSHILSEVSAICDQILIISKGKLAACDTPEGLTQRMQGGNELAVTVKGEESGLEECLNLLEGISGFVFEKSQEGTAKALVKLEEGADIDLGNKQFGALFYQLAGKRMPILDLHVAARSLEEVFLELTGTEQKVGETQAEEVQAEEVQAEEVQLEEEEADDDGDL